MLENRRDKIRKGKKVLAGFSCVLAAAAILSGCGRIRSGGGTVQESETAGLQNTQQTSSSVIRQSETETEPETQRLITSVDYTSKDGTVKITLPDNTWKVTQDADEMRVFSSGNDAMINIVHASTDAALRTLSIQTSRQNLESSLLSQYSDASAYDIESYEQAVIGNVNIYRYVVKYNAEARMWSYSVTYGIVAPNQAYVISGTVTDNNQTLLKAVEDSVDSFSVLRDEELKAVTDARTSGSTVQTPQTTAQTSQTAANSTSAVTTYSQQSTMYANDIVNIRSGPGTDTDVVGSVVTGGRVTVTGESGGWYQVNVNGTVGYIRKDFLTTTQTTTPSTTQSETTQQTSSSSSAAAEEAAATNYSTASTLYTTDGVNIRSGPATDSNILGTLGAGNAVTVVGETDNWYIVSTGSGTGYISKAYLSSTAPSASGGSSSGSGTDNSGTGSSSSGNNAGTGTGTSGTTSGGGSSQTSGTSTISGTVASATADTITVAGDDGNVYTIYTGDADVSTSDGLYSGLRISATVDNSQTASDGTRYAESVTGE